MVPTDYERVVQLWNSCDGIHMHNDYSETQEGIDIFLSRNPGLSFVALNAKEIVGVVLGSHDGRRGFINHLAVIEEYRKQGIASLLVENVFSALKNAGMRKIIIFVLKDNVGVHAFWKRIGFANEKIIEMQSIVV